MTNMQIFKKTLDDLYELFKKKNRDYGSAVFQRPLFSKMTARDAVLIALSNKVQRVKTLSKKSGDAENEPLEDSIRDLANYCVIWLSLLEKERGKRVCAEETVEETPVCDSPVSEDCDDYVPVRPFTCQGRFAPPPLIERIVEN